MWLAVMVHLGIQAHTGRTRGQNQRGRLLNLSFEVWDVTSAAGLSSACCMAAPQLLNVALALTSGWV